MNHDRIQNQLLLLTVITLSLSVIVLVNRNTNLQKQRELWNKKTDSHVNLLEIVIGDVPWMMYTKPEIVSPDAKMPTSMTVRSDYKPAFVGVSNGWWTVIFERRQ